MATRTPKNLASGYVSDSKGTLFTATTATYITGLSMINENAADQTVLLYRKPSGGSSRLWKRITAFAQYFSFSLGDEKLVMDAGDEIEAETTTASAVSFQIDGVEET
ncbi:MAG: hypothetical protein KC496_17075 [Anaerolineae bacterium]|nr:hypothetical protein [Anaerolineae bacterium]